MPAAWVSAAVGVVGAISAADGSRRANNTAADANREAASALEFDKQKYYDNKPIADALGVQSVQANAQDQAIAAQQAQRSQQAWNQNQQASAGVAGTVGLNALGGQYLNPEQQKELLGLQQFLAKQGQAQAPSAAVAPQQSAQDLIQQTQLNSADQARLAQLQSMQKGATQIGGSGAHPGYFMQGTNDSGSNGMWVPESTGEGGASSFTPAMEAELKALTDKVQAGSKKTIQPVAPGTADGAAPGLYNGMTADQVQARIQELQNAANQGAQQRELDKAGLVTGTADKYSGQLVGLGEENAQSILNDSQGLQDARLAQGAARDAEIRGTARQRASDFEQKAGTQANAAIATSADAANRQLLRLGGDPNRMAAMGLDTANNQQLARISAGNQIAGYNIASLNAADDAGRGQLYGAQDQAFGIKSAALDAARLSRTGAKQAAIGMNFGAAQQADTLKGNAKDVADAKLNSLAQGSLNMTQGFANTSGQNATGAVGAGTAGVGALATGQNNGVTAAGLVTSGVGGLSKSVYQPVNNTGAVANGLGQAASSIKSLYDKYTTTGGGAGLDSAARSASNAEGEYPVGLGG